MKRALVKAVDAQTAGEIAKYGRELSDIERTAMSYLWAFESLPKCTPGDDLNGMRRCCATSEQSLCRQVLSAVQRQDAETISALANVLKTTQMRLDASILDASTVRRLHILMLREFLNERRATMTVKEVAAAVRWRGSYDVLRRELDQCAFPLEKLPGGRPRKLRPKSTQKRRK